MKYRLLRLVAILALGAGTVTALAQSPPPSQPTLVNPAAPDYGSRPVAYIYENIPVTRAELAEFLIARGGYEKVELLVNKKIIETEAAKRNITVTTLEMEADLENDLKGIAVSKQQFIEIVLAKYGKTYYEWMEDVVRPRLLLTKMCKNDIQITSADLRTEFERQYGEKRKIQIIIWPKGDDLKSITRVWDEIRKDAKEYDRVATAQANPGLASTAGHVSPIGRNTMAEDRIIEEKAFNMKVGDVSEIFQTGQGYVVMKLKEIIPANDKVTMESVKPELEKNVFELKLAQAIPTYFAKLKEAAKPNILMSGPPSLWKFEKSNRELAEDVLKSQQLQPVKGKQ